MPFYQNQILKDFYQIVSLVKLTEIAVRQWMKNSPYTLNYLII